VSCVAMFLWVEETVAMCLVGSYMGRRQVAMCVVGIRDG
jgi:hypothetical protein